MNKYKLRPAKKKDLNFLFQVSTKAMLPVKIAINSNFAPNLDEEFKAYAKKYEPEKIQVIQFENIDVGRLRIVRTLEEIYIWWIQILPEYQNKGIWSAIFKDLITESNKLNIPIKLEVAKVNNKAKIFYEKFGFETVGEEATDWIMIYKAK